jgi:serine/threonine protein kinase
VLDLAAEEFRCREASGERVSADEFAGRFPGMERSLYFLLEVRRMMHYDSTSDLVHNDIIWPEAGEDFLGFSLLAELGKGTFGRVFLASEPAIGNRLVALKVATQGQWEAGILGKLGHPNIVPIYSIQKDSMSSLTAVCMPYLGRVTLLDVIEHIAASHKFPTKGQILTDVLTKINGNSDAPSIKDFDYALTRGSYVDGVVHLAIQMSDALSFTHEQGIFHRDLKPSNVLLTNSGRPLIFDFNLSSDETDYVFSFGGTLPYMAPEQIECLTMNDNPSQISNKASSDIFSLGVILYELLSGNLPFDAPNFKESWNDIAADLLDRQKRGPRPLVSFNPCVDNTLASLIEQCLAFVPDHRPLSAAAIAESLRNHRHAYRRAQRWVLRHPVILSLGIVALVIVGLLYGIRIILRDPYPVRLYKSGLAAVERGDNLGAVELFDQALRIEPNSLKIRTERANAIYKQEKYSQAFEEYSRIYAEHPTGEITAMKGHCLCQGKYYPAAIAHFEQALAEGYQSVSLFNNLGYSLMQQNKYLEAETFFRKSLALDSHRMETWQNLLRLCIKRYRREDLPQIEYQSLITGALAADRPTGSLYLDVSILESLMTPGDPNSIARVIEHLRTAISLGIDPRRIASERAFIPIKNQKDFLSLQKLSPGCSPSNSVDGIVNPF